MNIVIVLGAIIAVLCGFVDGNNKIKECRKNNVGVKSSDNLFSFLFLDK